jgi:hypothetical protein
VTTAGALIAVAAAVLFLALAGGSRSHHAAISHPAATHHPPIQYRGTGAPHASTAGTPPTTPSSPRKSYGAVP